MDSTSEVIHLCPLDEADKLPALTFDRCELCRPTEQYLADLVQPMRLLNHSSRWIFDTKTFAQFTWIVVRENRPLGSVGNRLMPMLYINVDDIDLVETHPSGLPTVVEHALFAVLLFPWEDVVRHANFQWQPFRIPWVYTIDKDPFAFPKPPPSPNALSWEPHIFKDGSEGEHPSVWDLDRDGLVRLPEAMHDLWAMASRVCPLRADSNGPFNPLIRHFTVKAFRERGIDELIAHIMAIEAALALQTDTNRRKDKRTATEKLCYRIRTLLGSENASEEFKTFYELRSDFVHGRLLRCKLRTKQLHVLRQIVRRVLLRMIEQIDQKGWSDRTEFLDHLSSPEGGNPRSS